MTTGNLADYELWILSADSKITVRNMTKEDAIAVQAEFVRQYCAEGWNIVSDRLPKYITKLTRCGEKLWVGIVDTSKPASYTQPPRWLVRVPAKAVAG